jgi:HSP20 family protein
MSISLAPPPATQHGADIAAAIDDYIRYAERSLQTETPVGACDRADSNLLETWESYWLQVALPGVETRSLAIDVVGEKVIIGGRQHPAVVETAQPVWYHLPHGEFVRTFAMPGGIDAERAEARYAEGILTVRLPKMDYIRSTPVPVEIAR